MKRRMSRFETIPTRQAPRKRLASACKRWMMLAKFGSQGDGTVCGYPSARIRPDGRDPSPSETTGRALARSLCAACRPPLGCHACWPQRLPRAASSAGAGTSPHFGARTRDEAKLDRPSRDRYRRRRCANTTSTHGKRVLSVACTSCQAAPLRDVITPMRCGRRGKGRCLDMPVYLRCRRSNSARASPTPMSTMSSTINCTSPRAA